MTLSTPRAFGSSLETIKEKGLKGRRAPLEQPCSLPGPSGLCNHAAQHLPAMCWSPNRTWDPQGHTQASASTDFSTPPRPESNPKPHRGCPKSASHAQGRVQEPYPRSSDGLRHARKNETPRDWLRSPRQGVGPPRQGSRLPGMGQDSHGRVQASEALLLPPKQGLGPLGHSPGYGTPAARSESPRQSCGPPWLVQSPGPEPLRPEPLVPHPDYQRRLHDPPG